MADGDLSELVREAMIWSRTWTDQEPMTDEELTSAVSYFLRQPRWSSATLERGQQTP
jgi:hypothetical protein